MEPLKKSESCAKCKKDKPCDKRHKYSENENQPILQSDSEIIFILESHNADVLNQKNSKRSELNA